VEHFHPQTGYLLLLGAAQLQLLSLVHKGAHRSPLELAQASKTWNKLESAHPKLAKGCCSDHNPLKKYGKIGFHKEQHGTNMANLCARLDIREKQESLSMQWNTFSSSNGPKNN
jgi:hypothetical protein